MPFFQICLSVSRECITDTDLSLLRPLLIESIRPSQAPITVQRLHCSLIDRRCTRLDPRQIPNRDCTVRMIKNVWYQGLYGSFLCYSISLHKQSKRCNFDINCNFFFFFQNPCRPSYCPAREIRAGCRCIQPLRNLTGMPVVLRQVSGVNRKLRLPSSRISLTMILFFHLLIVEGSWKISLYFAKCVTLLLAQVVITSYA